MKKAQKREQDVRFKAGQSQNEEGNRRGDSEQGCPRDQAGGKISFPHQGGPQMNENTTQGKTQKSSSNRQGGEVVPHEDREQPREGQFIQKHSEAE